MKLFNITASRHGALVEANCVRQASKIFRRVYKNEKIMYKKEAGKLRPKML